MKQLRDKTDDELREFMEECESKQRKLSQQINILNEEMKQSLKEYACAKRELISRYVKRKHL